MSDLRELYQQVILDHNKNPRNFRRIEDATVSAEGYNPLCGDHYTIFVDLDGDVIRDVAFEGSGCAISKASASIMTSTVKGKSRAEAGPLFEQFHEIIVGEKKTEEELQELGRLAVFAGVREYPSRVKCAVLPWHTMKSALEGEREVVSTETD